MVYGKVPPQAKELEEAVLGAIMLEVGAYDIVSEIVGKEAFYVDAHQHIFSAMQELATKGAPIDVLTVAQELKQNGSLEMVGGPMAISKLTKDVVSGANVEAHSRIVLQKFLQRELIRIAGEIITDAYEDTSDVFDMLDKAETDIFSLSQTHLHSDFSTISSAMVNVQKEIDRLQESESDITGVPSGFTEIDRITHGWQETDLIILAARPAVGKTAFALNLARNAMEKDVPVGMFSLEMSKEQLVKRLISSETEIPLEAINTGRMDEGQLKRFIREGVYKLGNQKMYIDDRAGINMFSIRSKARKMVNKHGVGLIIIDYLQLISGVAKNVNREQEVSKISRELKQLAKDLKIPVIALSQLSRDADEEEPMLKHLRESGAIEQDADMVMFLWRPKKTEVEKAPSLAFIRYWKIAKYRHGALDEGALPFQASIQKFKNPDSSPTFAPSQPGSWRPVHNSVDIPEDGPF